MNSDFMSPADQLFAEYLTTAKFYINTKQFAEFERQQPNCGISGYIALRRQAKQRLRRLKHLIRKIEPNVELPI